MKARPRSNAPLVAAAISVSASACDQGPGHAQTPEAAFEVSGGPLATAIATMLKDLSEGKIESCNTLTRGRPLRVFSSDHFISIDICKPGYAIQNVVSVKQQGNGVAVQSWLPDKKTFRTFTYGFQDGVLSMGNTGAPPPSVRPE